MKRKLIRAALLLALCLALGGAALAEAVFASGGDSYIRNSPSLSGAQLSLLPEGESAPYLGRSSVDARGVTWYYISYNGATGWVSSRYTELSGASYGAVYASGGDSYIRSEPELAGGQLSLFPSGASAAYLGVSAVDERGVTWYQIAYDGYTGWVSSRYTQLSGASRGAVYASGGDSYIREDPSLDGARLGLFPDGMTASYLGASAVDERGVAWYQVVYEGIAGWVSSRYTELWEYEPDGEPALDFFDGFDAEDLGSVYAESGDSYIRSQPNRSGAQLGLLPEGAEAAYLGRSEEDERGVTWFYISYGNCTGWVSSKYTCLY